MENQMLIVTKRIVDSMGNVAIKQKGGETFVALGVCLGVIFETYTGKSMTSVPAMEIMKWAMELPQPVKQTVRPD